MEIWIIRIFSFVIFPAIVYGCWKASGWLIEAGYIPGTTDPQLFGYGLSQGIGAMSIMMLMTLIVSIINWLTIGLPREKAKKAFWERRQKNWPR